MNFISKIESAEVQVELKYCERCGGLFLRLQAAEVVYCSSCTARLAAQPDFAAALSPASPRRARNPRMVKGPKLRDQELQGAAQIEYLQGLAALEVRS